MSRRHNIYLLITSVSCCFLVIIQNAYLSDMTYAFSASNKNTPRKAHAMDTKSNQISPSLTEIASILDQHRHTPTSAESVGSFSTPLFIEENDNSSRPGVTDSELTNAENEEARFFQVQNVTDTLRLVKTNKLGRYQSSQGSSHNGTRDASMDYSSAACGENTACGHFRQLMKAWPSTKPKAAIYVLVGGPKDYGILYMLISLYAYFNDRFQYPVIIFHEVNLNPYDILKHLNKSHMFFQEISFPEPAVLPERIPSSCSRSDSIGYRHMCRFQARLVYTHPIMWDLEYAWRMDSDSLLLPPEVTYDVFQFMRHHDLIYGYRALAIDGAACVQHLHGSVLQYANDFNINGNFTFCWPSQQNFYNNFEISKQTLWRSAEYQHYIAFIESLGGIYHYRWGDSPIKGLAVSLFVPQEKVHRFEDIGYEHALFQKLGNTPHSPFVRPLNWYLPCLNGTYEIKNNVRSPPFPFRDYPSGGRMRG